MRSLSPSFTSKCTRTVSPGENSSTFGLRATATALSGFMLGRPRHDENGQVVSSLAPWACVVKTVYSSRSPWFLGAVGCWPLVRLEEGALLLCQRRLRQQVRALPLGAQQG